MMPGDISDRWERLLPAAIVLVGVVFSIVGAVAQASQAANSREDDLRDQAELLRSSLHGRLQALEDALVSTQRSVQLLWPVDRPAFREIATSANELEALDGVLALSFVRKVPASATADYEALVAADDSTVFGGYPDFRVRPAEGDAEFRYVVEYLEPLFANEDALGFDIGSEPTRLHAVEAARDRGEAVATGPIDLVQGENDRAVLVLVAIYDVPAQPITAPARRRHFVGLLSAVLPVADLVDRVIGPEPTLDLIIHDVGRTANEPVSEITPDRLLLARTDERVGPDGRPDSLHTTLDLDVGSRRWQLTVLPNDRFRSDTGTPPWVVAAAGLLFTVLAGGAVARVAGERRRAEALVEQRTADLRQLVVDSPDATVVVARDGTIQLASNQVRTVLGYEPAELIGRPVEVLVPSVVRDMHPQNRERFHAAPATRRMGPRDDLSALHANGHEVPVAINLADLASGEVIASIRDVAEEVAARDELRELSDQKTAFLGSVSHELRTPLTAIKGFVSLLRANEREFDDAARADMLDRIARNTESLQALIEEILEFTLLERSGFTVRTELTDLATATHEALEDLRGLDGSDRITSTLQPAPCLLDEGALRRIVTNLVTNALRYAPTGPITVRVDPTEDGARLTVDDEGPGISTLDRVRVFDRFWRGENARKAALGGTGIGLAIVADLVELQGGAVSVGEAPGGGARFTVDLPRETGPMATGDSGPG